MDRIHVRGCRTGLRNVVELGFLWKKMRNNRVVLIKKHDARGMQVIIVHAGGHCGFIPTAVVVYSCHYYDRTLNFFILKLLVKIITTYCGTIHQVQFSLYGLYFLVADDRTLY
jgi:hypothetical protein